MKSNQQVEPIIADDFSSVTFKVEGHPDLVLDMNKLSPEIVRRAACVGMAQVRIVDAAAIGAADKAGNIIPKDERIAKKHAQMAALIAHYESGTTEWSRVKTAGPKGGFLFEALCKLYGHMKAPSEIRAWLDGLSDKEQAALREDDTVKPVIEAIKAAVVKPEAKEAAKVQAKTLLEALTSTQP